MLWAFQAHGATREQRRRPYRARDAQDADLSSEEDELDSAAPASGAGDVDHAVADDDQLAEQAEDRRWLRSTNVVARAGSTQQSAELAARQRISQEARRAARAEHLPWRGAWAEEARLLRVLQGLPPVGSSADADQLSDWEETLDHAKQERIRFGERDIVQIGRRRTLAEEELSDPGDGVAPMQDPYAAPAPSVLPSAWDMDSLEMDTTPWSDASASYRSIPVRVGAMRRGAPRGVLPADWERGPNAASYMAADLDGDDMDASL